MSEATKVCTMCKESKAVDEFGKSGRDGKQARCKACIRMYWQQPEHKKQKQEWAQRNKHKVLHHGFMRRFKMQMSEYEDRKARQGGKCACCGKVAELLAVDHDHACCPGKVTCGKCTRDLLCTRCNKALGFFGDNPALLRRGLAYLRKWKRLEPDLHAIGK